MKFSLLFILLVLFSYSIKGQIISGYGVKLGAAISNQTWVYKSFDIDYENKTGLSARVFADVLDFSFFELEGELGYTRKGFTEDIPITTMEQPDGTGSNISLNNSLDYLSISVLAKFKHNIGVITPYLVAGPQLNLLVNKNAEKFWNDFFNEFEKKNIGFSIGVGSEILNVLPVKLLAEYRFEKDFNDNNKANPYTIKNYSHVILIGVRF